MKDFFIDWHTELVSPDRLPTIIMAWLLVTIVGAVTGPIHGNANPFLWLLYDKTLGAMAARLDKKERKVRDLMFRGLIMMILSVVVAYTFGKWAAAVAYVYDLKGFTQIVFLALAMTGGSVWFALLRLFFAMRQKKVSKGAYYNIAQSSRRNLSASDDFTITRTAMGFAAKSFDKGLVGPAFWYFLVGLPGAFMYAILAAFVWRFGKEGFTKGFGKVALAVESLLGFVPHILAGVLVALAGLFTPTSGMTRAYVGLLNPEKRSKYEEGGLPLTAMAYALDVNLGGPGTDLDGSAVKPRWTGPEKATAQLEAGHLKRAMYLMLIAHLLFIASIIGMMFWSGMLF